MFAGHKDLNVVYIVLLVYGAQQGIGSGVDLKTVVEHGIELTGALITRKTGISLVCCVQACSGMRTCKSVNYTPSLKVCEINHKKKGDRNATIKTRAGVLYAEHDRLKTGPICENSYSVESLVDCGIPISKPNAVVELPQGTGLYSKATYVCNEGYVAVGKSAIGCSHNGIWEYRKFQCSYDNAKQYEKTLFVQNGGIWGSWGTPVFCPDGTYALGYKMKFEPKQGSADDTALNNIALICSDNTVIEGKANSQMWGKWLESRRCEDQSYLTSFRLRVEGNQGEGDDTAANAIKFKCRTEDTSYTKELTVNSDLEGEWGSWGDWSSQCSPNTDICGLQIKFEKWQQGGDDTALNDVRFFCCSFR